MADGAAAAVLPAADFAPGRAGLLTAFDGRWAGWEDFVRDAVARAFFFAVPAMSGSPYNAG